MFQFGSVRMIKWQNGDRNKSDHLIGTAYGYRRRGDVQGRMPTEKDPATVAGQASLPKLLRYRHRQ